MSIEPQNQISGRSQFKMTLVDTKHYNHRYMCSVTNYMALLSRGVDSAVQAEGQTGQHSSHTCVVHHQGAGLLHVASISSSAVPLVLPLVFHVLLESLFCHHLSVCVSPTAPCTASTCISPSASPHMSPQESSPRCLSSTCFPKYLSSWISQSAFP